jgi:poly(hydroxyalkanoate) depolymerase family esterase
MHTNRNIALAREGTIVRFQSPNSQAVMLEATRLVAAGRPSDATAILQRSLGVTTPDRAAERSSWNPSDRLREWFGRTAPYARGNSARPVLNPEARSEAGQFLSRTYHNGAGARDYRLYVPSGYNGQPIPLVVMLHGCKQSPEDFAIGTRMNMHAEKLIWLIAYPEQSAAANGSQCWNWFRPEDQRRDQGEPSLIAGITRQVMNDFAVDPARVYAAGLSAGGATAAIMGETYADLYAAVGIHSGLPFGAAQDISSAFAAMRSGARVRRGTGRRSIVPTILFHGDRDRTVNPQNAELILAQAAPGTRLQKTVERVEVPGSRDYTRTCYVDRTGVVVLEYWLIHGVAHAWSGGSRAGSYTDPQGPDATAEMMRFFSKHQRPTAG